MLHQRLSSVLLPVILPFAQWCAAAETDSKERGAGIYVQKCQVCHQAGGGGVPNVFPPLAASDFLAKERERAIKALCEGMTGRITVNGVTYDGQMPAQALDDRSVADVLNYVGSELGNKVPEFTEKEVSEVRAKTKFPTYSKLVAAMEFAPLPRPPEGFAIREVVRLPDDEFGTRMAARNGRVWMLTQKGSVFSLDPVSGAMERVIAPADYLDLSRGGVQCTGIAVGPDGALWLTSNQEQRRKDEAGGVVPLEVKAGGNARSKSLAHYRRQFDPPAAVRASLRNLRLDAGLLNIPLYAVPCLDRLLRLRDFP